MNRSRFQNETQVVESLLEALGDRDLTTENILDAYSSCMRKDIYHQFPTARPDVVEALLLMSREILKEIIEEGENSSEERNFQLKAEIRRFGRCIKKTLRAMNG